MTEKNMLDRKKRVLIIGDVIALGVVTLLGFASHDLLGTSVNRMLATFIPLSISWFLVSPWLGLFDDNFVLNWQQLWRTLWATLLAVPVAGWLRGIWLNSPVLPLFVVILGGVSALVLLLWRSLFLFIGPKLD